MVLEVRFVVLVEIPVAGITTMAVLKMFLFGFI